MLHGIEVPEIYDIQYKVFLLSLIFASDFWFGAYPKSLDRPMGVIVMLRDCTAIWMHVNNT